MTEKRIFDGVAVILEAVDFVATVEENEWSRGRGESKQRVRIGHDQWSWLFQGIHDHHHIDTCIATCVPDSLQLP
jgi:hypothetical protein